MCVTVACRERSFRKKLHYIVAAEYKSRIIALSVLMCVAVACRECSFRKKLHYIVAAEYKSRIIAMSVLITIAQWSSSTKRMSMLPFRLSAIFIFAHL
jgi:hypothetical protein